MEDREVKQSCVCDKVVCERWYVTKKDGVCVCNKVVCERWCVRMTKLCVKESVYDKVVCERWFLTKWCVKDGV